MRTFQIINVEETDINVNVASVNNNKTPQQENIILIRSLWGIVQGVHIKEKDSKL